MVRSFNPNTWESAAGGFLFVPGQPRLQTLCQKNRTIVLALATPTLGPVLAHVKPTYPLSPTFSVSSLRDLLLHLAGGPCHCTPRRWLRGGLHGFLHQGGSVGWLGVVLAPSCMLLSPTPAHRANPTYAPHMASSSATGTVLCTTCFI